MTRRAVFLLIRRVISDDDDVGVGQTRIGVTLADFMRKQKEREK